jgi:twitching motility protein PilT
MRGLIREGRNQEITAFMQSSGDGGMLTFDQHLAERVRTGLISYEVGLEVCHSAEQYKRLTGRL